MLTLPIDAVPDITNNQVQIVTVSPTLAPQEVEQLKSSVLHIEELTELAKFVFTDRMAFQTQLRPVSYTHLPAVIIY